MARNYSNLPTDIGKHDEYGLVNRTHEDLEFVPFVPCVPFVPFLPILVHLALFETAA